MTYENSEQHNYEKWLLHYLENMEDYKYKDYKIDKEKPFPSKYKQLGKLVVECMDCKKEFYCNTCCGNKHYLCYQCKNDHKNYHRNYHRSIWGCDMCTSYCGFYMYSCQIEKKPIKCLVCDDIKGRVPNDCEFNHALCNKCSGCENGLNIVDECIICNQYSLENKKIKEQKFTTIIETFRSARKDQIDILIIK